MLFKHSAGQPVHSQGNMTPGLSKMIRTAFRPRPHRRKPPWLALSPGNDPATWDPRLSCRITPALWKKLPEKDLGLCLAIEPPGSLHCLYYRVARSKKAGATCPKPILCVGFDGSLKIKRRSPEADLHRWPHPYHGCALLAELSGQIIQVFSVILPNLAHKSKGRNLHS